MITPYPHQIEISDKAYSILQKYSIVYLAMQERTGKTLTAILTCEKSPYIKKALVITKKAAIEGWTDTLKNYNHTIHFTVINYESCHKITDTDFDIVIIDEAHAMISGYPKVSQTWKAVAKHTKDKPIIYMSATPSAQGSVLLFNQFRLSTWSPFHNYRDFYAWFKDYGILKLKRIGARQIKDYSECREEIVWSKVKHLFISYTRTELGFKHEPNDIIHYVELDESTKQLYRTLEKDKYLVIDDKEFLADTPMGLLLKLHQIEGGTLKNEQEYIQLPNREKIDYILKTWGDSEDLVIFYHYKEEEHKLKSVFKKAQVLQANKYAEGVDLSMYEHLVVYSMDFKTAQYTQRRARQANMKRETPINVHFLLIKRGLSEQVYNTVAINKTNFVDKYFTPNQI